MQGFAVIVASITLITQPLETTEALKSTTTLQLQHRPRHIVGKRSSGIVPFFKRSAHCFLHANPTSSLKNLMMASEEEVVGQMRGGLVFLKTANRESLVRFYSDRIGMTVWLEQPNITVLAHGNMLLGFNQIHAESSESTPDLAGMYTFVYPSRDEVDEMYAKIEDISDAPPRINKRYRIYQFFATDPEGRKLEFQAFLHPLSEVTSKVM